MNPLSNRNNVGRRHDPPGATDLPGATRRTPQGEGVPLGKQVKGSRAPFTSIFKRGVEFVASKKATGYKSLKGELTDCLRRAEAAISAGNTTAAIEELKVIAGIKKRLENMEEVSQSKSQKLSDKLSTSFVILLEQCINQCVARATHCAQEQDLEGTLRELKQLEELGAMGSNNSLLCKGDQLKVKKILSQGPDLDLEGKGDSVLMLCIREGKPLRAIELLIKYGSNVNYTNTSGSSALSRAVDAGNAACIKLLVESGANVSERIYSKALFLLDETITNLLRQSDLSEAVADKLDALFLERVFALKMGIDCLYGCEKNPYNAPSFHSYNYYATGFVDSFYNYLRKSPIEDSPDHNTIGSVFENYSKLGKLTAEQCAEKFANGEIFTITLTIPSHLVTVTFFPPHYCSVNDRSSYTIEGTKPGVNIYRIPEDFSFTEEDWKMLIKPQVDKIPFNQFFTHFELKDYIPQAGQAYNNCSLVSVRSGVLASLIFFKYNQLVLLNGGREDQELMDEAKEWARNEFDTWKVDDRLREFKRLKQLDGTNQEMLRAAEQKLIHLVANNQGVQACMKLVNEGFFSRDEALRVAVRTNNADLLKELIKEDLESASWLSAVTYSIGLGSLQIKPDRLDFYEGLMHMAMLRGNVAVQEVMESVGAVIDDDLKPTESKADLLSDKSKAWPVIDAKVADTSFEATSEHLHLAIDAGYPEMVEFILDNGADPEAEILPGCTPLFLARLYGHNDIVDLLEEVIEGE